MAVCPAPSPDDPLVRGLLGSVDCNVQTVVQTGYATLFQPGGAFTTVLTVLMTVYVALIGYRLLLGRSQLNISELTLTAVKLGAVVALTTQWGLYQSLVYRFLFFGPEQIANVILHGLRTNGSVAGGDVFDGLQRAFTDLTSFSPATPPGSQALAPTVAGGPVAAGAGQLSTLLSKSGFDSLLLLGSAVILLLSSLGVLLASKIVLGLLLATGPVFIALLLFESTQGVFEGWLRASLAFAFAPLTVTLLLGLALTLLDPSLQQIETMRSDNTYLPGVAFAVAVLVIVFAGVAIGMIVAGGMIAAGFRPWRGRIAQPALAGAGAAVTVSAAEAAIQPRAARVASAMVAQERRDATLFARDPSIAAAATAGSTTDRRTTVTTTTQQASREPALDSRLGQQPRRSASPRTMRSGTRSVAASAGDGGA